MALDARRTRQSSSRIRIFPDRTNIVRIDNAKLHDRAAEGWSSLRGDVLAREEVELVGGFPGSAVHANRFRRARLSISERWLIVNDGRADGFAVAFDRIESMTIVPGSARSRYAIQIRYRDGLDHRSFFVKFADAVWPFRAGDDALRIATLLTELGIEVNPVDPEQNRKRLAMTHEDLRTAALETMVWSGKVTGPVGGWMGQKRAVCQAWLTSNSFVWRKDDGNGINRVFLDDLTGVSTGTWVDQGPYPVALLSILDEIGDRHELPFVFDTARLPDENRRDCAAMIGGLRMRDVAVTSQHHPLQPWNGIGSLLAAADAHGSVDSGSPDPDHSVVTPGEFEAQCLIEIARLNRDILGYETEASDIELTPVRPINQASAVSELERRHESGEIGDAAMRFQRQRFNALIEARGKLAAIAEQRAQGTRPAAILMHQRDAVMNALNDVIVPEPEEPEPMTITTVAPAEEIRPRMHLRLLPSPNR
jgi:hypothetical protein